MKSRFFESLENFGILRKFVIAAILMFVIPLLTTLSILYSEAQESLEKNTIALTLGLVTISATVGYVLARKIVISILKIASQAEEIAKGNFSKDIVVKERDETETLAGHFNIVTQKLREQSPD